MRTALWIALTFTVACGPSMQKPSGFARVDGDYDVRVTNAEGVVIAVNSHRNRGPNGDLAFWAGALEARMERTYGEVERLEIESDDGHEGIALRARTVEGGRPYIYWAAVYLMGRRDRQVVTVEAGGDEAYFLPVADEVEAAMRSVER
ncbi:MAG: hypothetical protein AAF411_04270 [Myxococcota bacterium]